MSTEGDVTGAAAGGDPPLPELPWILTDPRPPLAVGSLAFVAGAVVAAVMPEVYPEVLPICISGAVLGACGYGVYQMQKTAVRRGAAGSQKGIDAA